MAEPKDKYKAVWISHSSISDFLNCQRLYYLRNVYKDARTGHKLTITNPSLSLGSAIHEVLESLTDYPTTERFLIPLSKKFDIVWEKYRGKQGGFKDQKEEQAFKERAFRMLKNIENDPKILKNRAIKIKTDFIPNYWLNEEESIILCGKIDWIEYLSENNSVHIVDFKTGKKAEDNSSLQLPIYFLLATNTQKRPVSKASYWYLDNEEGMVEKTLPDHSKALEDINKIAARIKLARQLNHFVCEFKGCKHCLPYERILKGEGEKVGVTGNQDVYVIMNN